MKFEIRESNDGIVDSKSCKDMGDIFENVMIEDDDEKDSISSKSE